MLLGRKQICDALGYVTWRTAKRRLAALGITPRKAGREVYITDAQLEQAIQGWPGEKPRVTPNWDGI